MSKGDDFVIHTYEQRSSSAFEQKTQPPAKDEVDDKKPARYFLKLSTGAMVTDVPVEFCDNLDALVNDVEYLIADDTFSKMVYDRGSFPRPFIRWFAKRVVPLFNIADKPDGHPLGFRIVTLRPCKNGSTVLTVGGGGGIRSSKQKKMGPPGIEPGLAD